MTVRQVLGRDDGPAALVVGRLRALQGIRATAALLVLLWAALAADGMGPERRSVIVVTLVYLGFVAGVELASRVASAQFVPLMRAAVLVDGPYLVWVTHQSGGVPSPLSSVLVVHLGAVVLLMSWRSGLALVCWESVLLAGVAVAVRTDLLNDTDPPGASEVAARVVFVGALWLMLNLTGVLAVARERDLRAGQRDRQALADLAEQLEQAQRLAATDGLTKIANRRTFAATLEREVARAVRGAEDLSLVLLDIDHFKQLNDAHGHQTGDEVLQGVAVALTSECREFDTAARYGGEEFAVVLPGCGPEEGHLIAERLRRAVTAAPSVTPITASAGVATFPWHACDADTLVRAADDALYASKRAGRDRTTGSGGRTVQRAVGQRTGRLPGGG